MKKPTKSQEYTRGLKKYQDGGKVSQRPSYDEWKKKYNLKETDDYKLKEAYDLGYNPDKKTGHLPSINYKTGEFLKSGKHESVRKELDWYNSKEGAKFRAKNKIDSSGSYWKYVPKYAEGGKVATKTNLSSANANTTKLVTPNIPDYRKRFADKSKEDSPLKGGKISKKK